MSIVPIITFKAGRCEIDTSSKPYKVTPEPAKGYIYLYSEDDLVHFCWRERNKSFDDEENLDLIMLPTDGHFVPYEYSTSNQPSSKTNGRIFVLKFSSSSQRHLFWLQSKPKGGASTFSVRDQKIGQIVDTLLQGEPVNIAHEVAEVLRAEENGDDDEDETMEDVEGDPGSSDHHRSGSGGAGPGATGGDVREEGEGAREGGADGGRAAGSGSQDAATVVQNFLNSLKTGGMGRASQPQGKMYTTLPDLLPTAVTLPIIDSATPAQLDNFLSYLPPTIIVLAQNSSGSIDGMVEPDAATTKAAMEALSIGQKKAILRRVLRSPQFHQSLGSLTMAIRDGGLPSIADALGIQLENGGLMPGTSMPLPGGDAVEAFVKGVTKAVKEKK